MSRPKKLQVVRGRRVLVDYASRAEEDAGYNRERWRNQKEVMKFYNSKPWRVLSKQVLTENYYICARCGNDATLADHIIPVKVDWSLRLNKENIQPLCDSCHRIKTLKENKENNRWKNSPLF